MSESRAPLGEQSDINAISKIISVESLTVVDIGCGPGALARDLCAVGASVIGVEPDPIQAKKNRNASPSSHLTFIEAGAEKLPLPDASADGVFFCRSLHHVPIARMDDALKEAARVLKRRAGFLCVIEPAVTGSYFTVSRPFHDETIVRTEAQAALNRTATQLFSNVELYDYVQRRRYSDFEQMVARVTGQTFNTIRRDQVETDEVRRLFETGRTDNGDYSFEQPMLINVYRLPV